LVFLLLDFFPMLKTSKLQDNAEDKSPNERTHRHLEVAGGTSRIKNQLITLTASVVRILSHAIPKFLCQFRQRPQLVGDVAT
jgi:hypothetical protein